MADGDKTEEATQHKLTEARKKGQFARSADMVAAAGLVASVAMTANMAKALVSDGTGFITWASTRLPYTTESFRGTVGELSTAAVPLAMNAALMMGVICAAGVAVGVLQGGLALSTHALQPRFDRVNPFAGIKRIVSMQSLVDKAKMALKAVIMLAVGYDAIRQELPQLQMLSSMTAVEAMDLMLPIATRIAWKISLVVVIMGAIDMAWQIFQFKKQMRMTRQELIDEHKMLEGDPHVKARQRRFRRQLARRMRLDGVKDARVVVTNPTHYAVALAYGGKNAEIPRVVAKGKDYRAQVIKRIAKQEGIHIFEAPPLARSLYRIVNVGEHIPPSLFLATAEIMVMVGRLDEQSRQGSVRN